MSAGKSEEKDEEFKIENLIQKFQDYVLKNSIKENQFTDNPGKYLYFEEFMELFKRIKFEVRYCELQQLFMYKNNNDKHIL